MILPQSIGGCRLALPQVDRVLDFQGPASMVDTGSSVSQYEYTLLNSREATLRIRPIGSALSENICLAEHRLSKVGEESFAGAKVHFLMDSCALNPCSNIWGQVAATQKSVTEAAVLLCPDTIQTTNMQDV